MVFKLKLDEKGIPVVQDGNPVFINDETKEEEAFDPNQMFAKIHELGKENRKKRETNKTLNERLKAIEDAGIPIEELPQVVKAAKNAKENEGKVPTEVENIRKQWAEDNAKKEAIIREKDGIIQKNILSQKFASSPHFTGSTPKTTLTPYVAEKVFGDRFKVEFDDGQMKVVAYNSRGEPVYSNRDPSQPADFNEAMDVFLQEPAFKDLVKFNGAPGSGSGSGKASTPIQDKAKEVAALQEAQKTGNVSNLIKSKIK